MKTQILFLIFATASVHAQEIKQFPVQIDGQTYTIEQDPEGARISPSQIQVQLVRNPSAPLPPCNEFASEMQSTLDDLDLYCFESSILQSASSCEEIKLRAHKNRYLPWTSHLQNSTFDVTQEWTAQVIPVSNVTEVVAEAANQLKLSSKDIEFVHPQIDFETLPQHLTFSDDSWNRKFSSPYALPAATGVSLSTKTFQTKGRDLACDILSGRVQAQFPAATIHARKVNARVISHKEAREVEKTISALLPTAKMPMTGFELAAIAEVIADKVDRHTGLNTVEKLKEAKMLLQTIVMAKEMGPHSFLALRSQYESDDIDLVYLKSTTSSFPADVYWSGGVK